MPEEKDVTQESSPELAEAMTEAAAVEPRNKLGITWAEIKSRH